MRCPNCIDYEIVPTCPACGSDLSAVVFTIDEIEAWFKKSTTACDIGEEVVIVSKSCIGTWLRDPERGLAASVKKEGE